MVAQCILVSRMPNHWMNFLIRLLGQLQVVIRELWIFEYALMV